MTKAEKLELNKHGLIEEYKNLNNMTLTIEISSRMSDIMAVLVEKYGMDFDEVIALED